MGLLLSQLLPQSVWCQEYVKIWDSNQVGDLNYKYRGHLEIAQLSGENRLTPEIVKPLPFPNYLWMIIKFSGKINGVGYTKGRGVRYNYRNNQVEIFGNLTPNYSVLYDSIAEHAQTNGKKAMTSNWLGTWKIGDLKISSDRDFVWNPAHPNIMVFVDSKGFIKEYNASSQQIIFITKVSSKYNFSWSPSGDLLSIHARFDEDEKSSWRVYKSPHRADNSLRDKLLTGIGMLKETISGDEYEKARKLLLGLN